MWIIYCRPSRLHSPFSLGRWEGHSTRQVTYRPNPVHLDPLVFLISLWIRVWQVTSFVLARCRMYSKDCLIARSTSTSSLYFGLQYFNQYLSKKSLYAHCQCPPPCDVSFKRLFVRLWRFWACQLATSLADLTSSSLFILQQIWHNQITISLGFLVFFPGHTKKWTKYIYKYDDEKSGRGPAAVFRSQLHQYIGAALAAATSAAVTTAAATVGAVATAAAVAIAAAAATATQRPPPLPWPLPRLLNGTQPPLWKFGWTLELPLLQKLECCRASRIRMRRWRGLCERSF